MGGSAQMSKNIVVCCDGTGNEFGDHNTNVVSMYAPIVRDSDQVAYYDPGIGTFSIFGRTLGKKVGTTLGLAFGYGLRENIEDAYQYLMDRYEPGDKLYLFGFSRGAFTVRALAGMLHKVGLLQKGSVNLVPYATEVYNIRDNDQIAQGFKETYCHTCAIHFIGVWDTVGSLGTLLGKQFYDDRLNTEVSHAYHAMSIDEKRRKFPVSIWDENHLAPGQNVVQVWFAGVHSDVGGSYKERGLSDVALVWMLENAERHGLQLNQGWKDALGPDPLGEMHESRKGAWKVWRPVERTIPEGARIHESVLIRAREVEDYEPILPEKYVVVT
jgi:uncharacterized protein (DUF2235 family)